MFYNLTLKVEYIDKTFVNTVDVEDHLCWWNMLTAAWIGASAGLPCSAGNGGGPPRHPTPHHNRLGGGTHCTT